MPHDLTCQIRIRWFFFGFLCWGATYAQDTAFVGFVPFQGSIISMAGDGYGTIWFNSGNALYTFDGKNIQKTGEMEARECLVYYKEELQTMEGLRRQGIEVLEPWKENGQWAKFLPGASAHIFTARDKKGRIWVTNGQDLHAFRITRNFKVTHRGGSIRGIFPSEEGIYVSTYSGLFLNSTPLTSDSFFSNGNMLYSGEGQLLVPQRDLIVFNTDDRTFRKVCVQHALSRQWKMELSCLEKAYGDVWAGSTLGLLKVEEDSLYKTAFSVGIQNMHLYGNTLYLATDKGIYTWDAEQYERVSAFPEIQFNDIRKIGGTWWACSKKGLWSWDESQRAARVVFSHLPVSNLETYCIAEDKSGYIWVSTISGLIRFLPGSDSYELFFSNKEFNARSAAVIGDTLYFGTVNGLVQFNPRDLPKGNLQREVTPYLASRKFTFLLGGALVLSGLVIFFLFRKWKAAERALQEQVSVRTDPPQGDLIADLEAHIEANLPMVTVESLCQHSGLSLKSLYRILESNHGLKPGDLIRNIKLRRIQEILAEDPNIDREVLANRVGYSVQHISRLLTKITPPD
jgi:AraC-like DNA-binding protein